MSIPKRTSEPLVVVSAERDWRPDTSDPRAVRSEGGSRGKYKVPVPFWIEPKFVSGFLYIERFSDEEREAISSELDITVDDDEWVSLSWALERLIVGTARGKELPRWKHYAEHLKVLISHGKCLAEELRLDSEEVLKTGIVSAKYAVNYFLSDSGIRDDTIVMVRTAERELRAIEAHHVKRGRPNKVALDLFAELVLSIVLRSNGNTALPSNNIRERSEPYNLTPIVKGTRALLEATVEKAQIAFENPRFSERRKLEMEASIESLQRITDVALVDVLRKAKRAKKAEQA